MTEYFGPEFIYQDIGTIPGNIYINQTLKEMEAKLGKKLPENFPLSLWMITFLTREQVRQELILPDNPIEEAIYWLGFRQPSYQLKDSLLMRITDRPQSFMAILDHPEINKIIRELRKAYDGREIKRVETDLSVPCRDWLLEWSFTATPRAETVHVVYPENGTNIAHDFEEVFKKYNVLDDLLKRGYKESYGKVSCEDILISTII